MENLSSSEDTDRYWGKAQDTDAPAAPGWHLFALHSLDVVAVADAWLATSPALRRAFGADDPQHRGWLRLFIALHDLGKLDVRFQSKAPAVRTALARYPAREVARITGHTYAHGPEGYWLACDEFPNWIGDDAQTDDILDAWLPWLAAVTGHHGALPGTQRPPRTELQSPAIRALDRRARAAWVGNCVQWFLHPAGLSLRDPPPFPASLLAGFCSICDWLGSNTGYFPYTATPQSGERYLAGLREPALRALHDSGLCRPTLRVGGMHAVFPERRPRQIQRLIDALPTQPGLTLIEAPTGSGKTEAALAHAASLLATGHADGIVFALPTHATANAMLARLEAVAPRLFPGTDANVVLAHGKARYQPRFIDLRRAARVRTVQQREEAFVQCADWLAQSRKRALLGQIGVCTVDQVLLSVLPVHHAFVRSFGIQRSVLIVDEVHAYDRYMYGLLEAVLSAQRAAGGSALLLSATLPRQQRERLLAAWQPAAGLPAGSGHRYPLLTHLSGTGTPTLLPACDADTAPEPAGYGSPPRTVAIRCVETAAAAAPMPVLEELITKARGGARVAVICNLVDTARSLAGELRACAADVRIDLFHARFRFRDRLAHETTVLAAYGPDAPAGGRILVATQVVEQSLDLCLDWLVTQLCPIDLLFQRLGRLHRHLRPRPPGCETAACTVLIPTEPDFGVHRAIYGDARVLWRTARRLRGCNGILRFPAAYRDWIEDVYDEAAQDEPPAIAALWDRYWADQCELGQRARRMTREQINPFADRDEQIRALTRADADALSVLPQSAPGRLLDGREIAGLGEWERDEAIDLEIVQVPRSWKSWLPPVDADGRIDLPMRADGDGVWIADGPQGWLRYSIGYGMERQTQ